MVMAVPNTGLITPSQLSQPFTTRSPVILPGGGVSIDFTSIPNWVKRIMLLLDNVSLSGTASLLVQLGSGSIDTTGYTCGGVRVGASTVAAANNTSGFSFNNITALSSASGFVTFCLLGTNIWVANGIVSGNNTEVLGVVSGSKTLSGVLDRFRFTSSNGTDTFDSGTVNIFYE